jgi:dGTPase
MDRVVFSAAFRRLQDKTQVFPLPLTDYVRTRLTHSLETSCVGRSMGAIVGQEIVRRHDLGSLLAPINFGITVAVAA